MKRTLLPLSVCLLTLMLMYCNPKENTAAKTEGGKPEVVKLMETYSSWNGDSLPRYPEGKPKITVLKITIPPHTELKVHKHPVINAGVILKGKLTIISEQHDTIHLKQGDAVAELVNVWHRGMNESDEPLKLIVFYAGAEDTPITVLHEGGPTDTH